MAAARVATTIDGNEQKRRGMVVATLAAAMLTSCRVCTTSVSVIHCSSTHRVRVHTRREMKADKTDVLKRLNYIEGHLGGIRKMVEEDKYCVDILRQTYAVRKAIEKLEMLILENHLASCVPEGIREGREEAVIAELVQLYNLAGNR